LKAIIKLEKGSRRGEGG